MYVYIPYAYAVTYLLSNLTKLINVLESSQKSRHNPYFMEPETSLPDSHESATDKYLNHFKSVDTPDILSLTYPIYVNVFDHFAKFFGLKLRARFETVPCILHASPI